MKVYLCLFSKNVNKFLLDSSLVTSFDFMKIEIQKHSQNEKYLYAQLMLIKAAHACNMSDEFTKNSYYVNHVLRPVLRSQDLSLRIDGWTILTSNAKGLADFSSEELALIKEALSIDLNNQNQNYRSEFFAGIKKAFSRLKAVIYALHRQISRSEKYFSDNSIEIKDRSDLLQDKLNLQEKIDFFVWIHKFMVYFFLFKIQAMSLFPGASIQRSSSSLEFISFIFEWHDSLKGQLVEFELGDIPGFPILFDDSLYGSLLHFMIHADYEPDRRKAFILLQKFDAATNFDSLIDCHEMSLQLLNSRHQSQIEAGILISMFVYESFQLKSSGPDFVENILEILQSNINIAEQNLWKCATETPIYPYLSVLKNLIVVKKISIEKELVVELAERAIQSVLVVCADDSPGRHFSI